MMNMAIKASAKEKILKTFKESSSNDPLTPLIIAKKTRLNRNSVRRLVQEMKDKGELGREKRGTYSLPSGR